MCRLWYCGDRGGDGGELVSAECVRGVLCAVMGCGKSGVVLANGLQ